MLHFSIAKNSLHDRLLTIVIDNAHELPVAAIREFRYLMNFEMGSKNMLALISVDGATVAYALKALSDNLALQFLIN